MSHFTHFLDILVKDPDEIPHVIGLLVKAVHSWIRYEFDSDEVAGVRQEKVAIALPHARLSDGVDSRKPYPGDILRVFSVDSALLDKLLRYPTLLTLRELDAVVFSPINPLQATHIIGHQRWCRSRKPERQTEAFRAREKRRNERRQHPGKVTMPGQEQPCPSLFIRTTSTETQKRFSLFITVHDGDPACGTPGTFNSYGLIVGDGVGVPVLREDIV